VLQNYDCVENRKCLFCLYFVETKSKRVVKEFKSTFVILELETYFEVYVKA